MRTESATMPQSPYEIELHGEFASVLLYENVEAIAGQDESETERFAYDFYRIDGLRNRPSLIDLIDRNLDEWLNLAKETEYGKLASFIRDERNIMLAETDWTQVTDAPLTKAKVKAYKEYRQALRDIPQQDGFPYEVEWPKEV